MPSIPDHPHLKGWKAPEDYQAVGSELDGVSIWAPIPPDEEASGVQDFKCPSCGAATAFDVAAGGVSCKHCGHVSETRANVVGHAARSHEFTLAAIRGSVQGWGVQRSELHCGSCGADIRMDDKDTSTAFSHICPFCASTAVDKRAATADGMRPEHLLPFTVEENVLRDNVTEWLGKGWYHPASLVSLAKIENFVGIYLPFWSFAARMDSTWKAQVGYEKQRSVRGSDGNYRTETYIDWRWENGRVQPSVRNCVIPGSSQLTVRSVRRIEPFAFDQLAAYEPAFLAGWMASSYDVTLPDAWESGRGELRQLAKDACYGQISTNHVRNFSMSCDMEDEAWKYVLLPVYMSAYQFNGKVYRVLVNGQTGQVGGPKPVAWWKIWLAITGLLTPGLGCGVCIGLPLLIAGPVGLVILIFAAVGLVFGYGFSYNLYKDAVEAEAE